MNAETTTTDPRAEAIGARLREVRTARGLSLQMVEEKTDGEFTATTVGAYERGDRNMSVARLAGLADVYQVPLRDLLPETTTGHYARFSNATDLFDPQEPEESLLRLAEKHGYDQVFLMIKFIRDVRGDQGNRAGRVQHQLAKKMVDDRASTLGGDQNAAITEVGEELGYATWSLRSNFRQIVKGIAQTSYTESYTDGSK